jgi:hypothetical protein
VYVLAVISREQNQETFRKFRNLQETLREIEEHSGNIQEHPANTG